MLTYTRAGTTVDKEYQTVVLAALLHDIGKFWQRTGQRHSAAYDSFTEEDYGEHGAHAKWSADFIETYLPEQWRGCGSIVLYHHRPVDYLSKVVSIADHLSAAERERDPSSTIWQLRSIFTEVWLGRNFPTPAQGYYYGIAPLQIDKETLFPSQKRLADDECTQAYTDLWDKFTKDVDTLNQKFSSTQLPDPFNFYFTNLYNLLQRYTSCIPSAGYKAVPDIPLFDHARTTCAIAACIRLLKLSEDQLDRLEGSSEQVFLLIGGDVSGIQDYLYDIANVGTGGVAKRLRARSFYISSLVEVTAHRLLHSLVKNFELPLPCVIINSGGKFVLLAPNLPEVQEKLRLTEGEINRWLWERHQGDLSILLAAMPLSPTQFSPPIIGDKLAELEDALNQAKTRKLSSVLVPSGMSWDEKGVCWPSLGFPSGDCPSCHKMPATRDATQDVDKRLCQWCNQDRVMGESLANACYLAYTKGTDSGADLTFFDHDPYSVMVAASLKQIPTSAYLVEDVTGPAPSSSVPISFPVIYRPFANYVPRFSKSHDLGNLCHRCTSNRTCEYRNEAIARLNTNRYPLYSFECLAAVSRDSNLYGSELLGVLKGDVDRLGFILSDGFKLKVGGASFSRLAAFSRQLDLFFSAWTDYSLKTKFPTCYTVYSGGDDFLFVGPWQQIIELANHIRDDFTRYVANNENITLSVGIAVTKPKFPIAKSSRLANEYLETAKEGGRNRLHLFGITVPWTSDQRKGEKVDFSQLEEWAQLLQKSLDPGLPEKDPEKLSTAFVHRLLHYAEQCREWLESKRQGKPKVENLVYLSHLAYDIARNVNHGGTPSNVRDRLISLTDLNNSPVMSQLRLPITWALLRWRR